MLRMFKWLRGNREGTVDEQPFDLEKVLAEGLRDQETTRQAISRLKRERKALEQQRKIVDRQFNRLTSGRVKLMYRGAQPGAIDLATSQLSQAMQDAGSAESSAAQNSQLVSIDERIQAIDRAIAQLNGVAR